MSNDTQIIASSIDSNIRTYDLRKGQLVTDFLENGIHSFDISFDKKILVASCKFKKLIFQA
jgi:hypothetical protein